MVAELSTYVLFILFKLQGFSLGVLIAASVAISAINEVEDSLGFLGDYYDYDADSYRGAAGWLIFVACAAIIYHIATIIVRILYMTSVIEKHHQTYALIVSNYTRLHRYTYVTMQACENQPCKRKLN